MTPLIIVIGQSPLFSPIVVKRSDEQLAVNDARALATLTNNAITLIDKTGEASFVSMPLPPMEAESRWIALVRELQRSVINAVRDDGISRWIDRSDGTNATITRPDGSLRRVNTARRGVPASNHAADKDCCVDPRTSCCVDCGVEHGPDRCASCGAMAFHRPQCPELYRRSGKEVA